jgi:hypothetical protein
MDNFMGTADFAADCRLLNKESLRLKLNRKTNELNVTASDQLIIENSALGYVLKYDLIKFQMNLETKVFMYHGYPFFEEMKTTRAGVEKKWKQNREEAYHGSLMHFMRSMFHHNLQEEKFEVREWVDVSIGERQRIKALYPAASRKRVIGRAVALLKNGSESFQSAIDTGKMIHADTINYFKSVMEQMDQPDPQILVNRLLGTGDFASLDSGMMRIDPEKHFQVIYTPKRNPLTYQKFLPKELMYQSIRSEFTITRKPVFVVRNGSFYEGVNTLAVGYWAWSEKMCSKLPYDYQSGK